MRKVYAVSQNETMQLTRAQLYDHFVISDLMQDNAIRLTYTFYDRLVLGSAVPSQEPLQLTAPNEFKSAYFLERRELGVINIGSTGNVIVDGKSYELNHLDCLYVGMGAKEVSFTSEDLMKPSMYYLLSAPAHKSFPTTLVSKADASPQLMGGSMNSNERVVYKYIYQQGVESCQLVMGLTLLSDGSVWNSFPPHTHTRRSEVYFYFNLQDSNRVFHFVGDAIETRHVVIANNQAVLSPPWSTHFGCGTSAYGFIWGMAGENKEYTDMDPLPIQNLV
ncbi:MAG: 5-dehydro-4-deoxy-D-glucuronate isomerase [Chitinophagales bacterium]|jgi:4-deoxy-L-threo-5-hexosulose-uronate ketol-isomerase|nr:5-dehydro-4-deoxy-D-glucuronate isomerase [Chitinophagales bacterium]